MIIRVPPNNPLETVLDQKNYMCWLGTSGIPENSSIKNCIREAEENRAKLFLSITFGAEVEFCRSRKIRNIGDVCRVCNNKVVFFQNNPSKSTIRRQINLMEEIENETSDLGIEFSRAPTPVAENVPSNTEGICLESFSFLSNHSQRFLSENRRLSSESSSDRPQIPIIIRQRSYSRDSRRSSNSDRSLAESIPRAPNPQPNAVTRGRSLFREPKDLFIVSRQKLFRKYY